MKIKQRKIISFKLKIQVSNPSNARMEQHALKENRY